MATSQQPTLPGAPVQIVTAGTVEPGELLVCDRLPEPMRVWWRLGDLAKVTVLLSGEDHSPPVRLHLDAAEPVGVTGRGQLLPREEQITRLRAACNGALWLVATGQPDAPEDSDIAHLLNAYARLSGHDPATVRSALEEALPRPR
jgi:hypothetical protein